MIKILVLTDNVYIYIKFLEIIKYKTRVDCEFIFRCSPSSSALFEDYKDVKALDIKKEYESVINDYDLVISCHCKKIFPKKLVNSKRCINIHPGLNPYNRGWYPQVFAINNQLPHGATIHVMDEEIDHGDIITQGQVYIESYDTSLSVYEKVVQLEMKLFEESFDLIIDGTYSAKEMATKGNYNGIEDFKRLCKLDLNNHGSLREHIDLLRSLTHGDYKNAYFIDVAGNKVFVGLNLSLADSDP